MLSRPNVLCFLYAGSLLDFVVPCASENVVPAVPSRQHNYWPQGFFCSGKARFVVWSCGVWCVQLVFAGVQLCLACRIDTDTMPAQAGLTRAGPPATHPCTSNLRDNILTMVVPILFAIVPMLRITLMHYITIYHMMGVADLRGCNIRGRGLPWLAGLAYVLGPLG